jgi:hypothetical protein
MRSSCSGLESRLYPWRAPATKTGSRVDQSDDASRTLERLGRRALANVPHVIARCTFATLGALARRGYVDDPDAVDRAWRFTDTGRQVFCVIDEEAERSLLGCIVGGAMLPRPSAIERTIVAEAIGRLLGRSANTTPADFCEEPRARPSSDDWRCELELRTGGEHNTKLALFTAAVAAAPRALSARPDLREMTMSLRAMFPSFSIALDELSAWHGGTLLRMRRPQRDLSIWLCAGGRRLATAQLGTLLGERAARVIALHPERAL